MEQSKAAAFRILMLITTPKLADKAERLYHEAMFPANFQFNAQGTASSEIVDLLGLGNIDKRAVISIVPKAKAKEMLERLNQKLRLGGINSGIAFTLPVLSGSKILLTMPGGIDETAACEEEDENNMETKPVEVKKHALITAVVNHGFSEEVMEAAREAGAMGGTVFSNRQIADEHAVNFWGHNIQEERETIIILTKVESKTKIMRAISEKCGVNSPAKGIVLSIPVDDVMGIGFEAI